MCSAPPPVACMLSEAYARTVCASAWSQGDGVQEGLLAQQPFHGLLRMPNAPRRAGVCRVPGGALRSEVRDVATATGHRTSRNGVNLSPERAWSCERGRLCGPFTAHDHHEMWTGSPDLIACE
ncbi:hypothetical protein A6A29_21620 [Streptomyces sp. TSRI0281]|nr:hypothetical protein A6A29_21620 [Streptomyces sp. TSRI0281]